MDKLPFDYYNMFENRFFDTDKKKNLSSRLLSYLTLEVTVEEII